MLAGAVLTSCSYPEAVTVTVPSATSLLLSVFWAWARVAASGRAKAIAVLARVVDGCPKNCSLIKSSN